MLLDAAVLGIQDQKDQEYQEERQEEDTAQLTFVFGLQQRTHFPHDKMHPILYTVHFLAHVLQQFILGLNLFIDTDSHGPQMRHGLS